MEFLFLTPILFLSLPILFLTKCRRVATIHSHGLIAGFVSVFWGKIFGKKVSIVEKTPEEASVRNPLNNKAKELMGWKRGEQKENVADLGRQEARRKKMAELSGVPDFFTEDEKPIAGTPYEEEMMKGKIAKQYVC